METLREARQRPQRTYADGTPLVPDSETLATDEIFRLLSDYRRRHLLTHLLQKDGSVPLASVADYIVTRELGVTPEQVLEARKQVYLTLYHSHVPKLEEAGFVAYDQAEDRVRATAETERVLPYLGLSDPSA